MGAVPTATKSRPTSEIDWHLCAFMVPERLLTMGSPRDQQGNVKMTANPPRPPPPRPAGEQAIGTQLYALIRQAIAELESR